MVRDYILACGGTSPPWSSAEEHFLGLYYHSTPIEQFPEYNSDEETPLPPLEDPAENPVDPQNSLSTLSENLPAPTWTWTFWKDEQVELPPECYIGDYLCLRFLLLVVMVIFCCTVLIMPATSSAAINAATYTTKGYSYLSDKLSEYHVSGYIILIPSFILWMGLEFYFWRRWVCAHIYVADQRYAHRYENLHPADRNEKDNRIFKRLFDEDPSPVGIILGTLFSLLMFTGLTAPFLVAWGYIIDIYYNCGDEELESTMEKMDVKSGVCVAGVRHAKRGITKIVAGGKGMVVSGAAATLERHVFTRNMTHPRDFPKANVD